MTAKVQNMRLGDQLRQNSMENVFISVDKMVEGFSFQLRKGSKDFHFS